MKLNEPIKFNTNPVTSNRKLKKFGRNVFWSLCCPICFTLLALILSGIAGEPLFIIKGDQTGTLKNIMLFIKAITLTIIAAMALNANLNSGRMDFSLGATGLLGSLLAALVINRNVATIQGIVSFLVLTILFCMILGFINSIIFITLKLPPIVMSLGMCLVFEGISKIIVGSNSTFDLIDSELTGNFFMEPIVIIPILLICCTFMAFALCYTKYGYNKLALVYDQKVCVETGINEVSNCIVSFIIAGALIGIYQVIDSCSLSNIGIKVDLGSSTTVFKNFLPIFIGGILAKYNNQIVGLLLAVYSTTMLKIGMDAAVSIGFKGDVQKLITGFSVFAVLVYMVDKNRFVNWVKKRKYMHIKHKLKEEE